jgi:uncharacterized protein with von Willebrand factor type A (vWA) domain
MDYDEILRRLDLSGETYDRPVGFRVEEHKTEEPPPDPPAETALQLDAWGRRRGDELYASESTFRSLGLDAPAVADFFGVSFEPAVEFHERCVDPHRLKFLTALVDTPGYAALRVDTVSNDEESAVAAQTFALEFDKFKRLPEEKKEDEEAVVRAADRAATTAADEVHAFHEGLEACGMGKGCRGAIKPETVTEIFRMVRYNRTLRTIFEKAGRFRRVGHSKQRQRTDHGYDDLIGVSLGNEVSRLLTQELVRLAVPGLDLDFLRRFVERQCQCLEYASTEPAALGPVIYTVDTSGSMAGEKVHTAKALALAGAWHARRQNRWCGLITYSGDTGHSLLALPPGRWPERAVLDWLLRFEGRGSYLDVPIRELPQFYEDLKAPRGKTDVTMVTDAICQISASDREKFNAWKRSVQARVITLVIHSQPGDLAAVSDEVHVLNSLEVTENGFGAALSF